MSRIFITHVTPRDKVLEYNIAVAASNFSHNLIEGKCFEKVYIVLPTFVCGHVEKFEGLVYSPYRLIRKLRYFAPIFENIAIFKNINSKDIIWYYNCTILNATLIILLGLLKPKVQQNIILLDYTPKKI